jgi:hypothetical protein
LPKWQLYTLENNRALSAFRFSHLNDDHDQVYSTCLQFTQRIAVESGVLEYKEGSFKNLSRAFEKALLREYEGESDANQGADGVCDVVRCCFLFKSFSAARKALELMFASDEITVVRIKNRFSKPTSAGWADLMINFCFKSDPNKHICELQAIHIDMFLVRKEMGAHHEYSKFRWAMEILLANGHSKLVQQIDDGHGADEQAQSVPLSMRQVNSLRFFIDLNILLLWLGGYIHAQSSLFFLSLTSWPNIYSP